MKRNAAKASYMIADETVYKWLTIGIKAFPGLTDTAGVQQSDVK